MASEQYIQLAKKSLLRKCIERGITIVVWLVMFWLLNKELVKNVNRHEFTLWIGSGGSIVMIVLFVYTAWGYYNYMVYGRRNRRRAAPSASAEEMAACYHLNIDYVKRMQRRKENSWRGPVTIDVQKGSLGSGSKG